MACIYLYKPMRFILTIQKGSTLICEPFASLGWKYSTGMKYLLDCAFFAMRPATWNAVVCFSRFIQPLHHRTATRQTRALLWRSGTHSSEPNQLFKPPPTLRSPCVTSPQTWPGTRERDSIISFYCTADNSDVYPLPKPNRRTICPSHP